MTWAVWNGAWAALCNYGLYVLGAYLLVPIVIASEIVVLIASRRSILEHLGLSVRNGCDRP